MSTREEKMTQLVDLIDNINTLHKIHSEDWLKTLQKTYNLKKTQVCDICINENDPTSQTKINLDFNFIIYMNEYCDYLNKVYFHPFYDFLDSDSGFNVTTRIKDPDSRISKLWHYRLSKREKGKVNINKCLNDLMGFRILSDEFEHDENTIGELKQMLENPSVKVHNSCKGNYKATHVYFQNGNNIYFPWELQIWNTLDHDSNIKSHALHKQAYTKWPSIYIESV